MAQIIRPAFREWAKYLQASLPDTQVEVLSHFDESRERELDIFVGRDGQGIVAATIGVMEFDQSVQAGVQIFTEIMADAKGDVAWLPNLVATLGFYVIKGQKVSPGVVLEGLVEVYAPGLAVRNVLFVEPFQWESGMTEVKLQAKTIFPLLAVGITEKELGLAREKGVGALHEEWGNRSVDVLDWGRENSI